MNLQTLMSQLMKSKNPEAMINNLANSNPQMKQALAATKLLQQQGGSKKDMIMKACQQSGIDFNQVEKVLNNFGIKF